MPRDSRFGKRVARPGDVASSTQNQALSALLFLYKIVLDRPLTGLVRPGDPPERRVQASRAGSPCHTGAPTVARPSRP
jgi:hypothetical protein